jgi:hypothetical protein
MGGVWRHRWSGWLLLSGVWTLPGLYFAIQVYLQRAYEGRPVSPAQALLRGLIFWALWALSSPAVVRLARAFPLARGQRIDGLLFHLPAGLIISLALLLIYVLLAGWAEGARPQNFDQLLAQFQPAFLSGFAWWSLVYWMILIASHAYDYNRRYEAGRRRASQLEARLAQAQLEALRMQLHPHFLFNTLHSIAALIHDDVSTADRMIARLGDFLRMTLHRSGAPAVTLSEELKFLECYLAIERLRFQDRLTTRLEVEEEALEAEVPNLLLQPIVENAIKHGIAPQRAPGRLVIRARRRDARLHVEVEDNGRGLLPTGAGSGLGLSNTWARLAQTYGADHLLELAEAPGGGLRVTVEIPFHAAQNGAAREGLKGGEDGTEDG